MVIAKLCCAIPSGQCEILLEAFQTVTMCPHWEHLNMLKLQCIGGNDDENPYYFAQYCPTKQDYARGGPNFAFQTWTQNLWSSRSSMSNKSATPWIDLVYQEQTSLTFPIQQLRSTATGALKKETRQTFKDQIVVSYKLFQIVLLHPSQCSYMVLRQCDSHQNFVWRTSAFCDTTRRKGPWFCMMTLRSCIPVKQQR